MTKVTEPLLDLPEGASPVGTKGRILSAALAAFAEEGFAGASMRTIAAHVDINPATLYAHFSSKEDIFLELVRIGSDEFLRLVSEATTSVTDPAERLDALMRAALAAQARYPRMAIVTTSAAPSLSRGALDEARTSGRAAARLLREILDAGRKDGSFTVDDVELTALTLEAMIQRVPQWVLASARPVPQIIASCGELAHRMVGSAGSFESPRVRRTPTRKA